MFIEIFKKNYITQLLLLAIVPILLWIPAFLHPPQIISTRFDMTIYYGLYALLKPLPLLATIIAFSITIINGLFLNFIFTSNKLVSKTTYLPAFMYYLLSSSNYTFMTLSSLLMMNCCLILALFFFYRVYDKKENAEDIFTTSLILSIGMLFYAPTVLLLLWIWVGFFVYKTYSWKDWLISIFGFLAPIIFLIVYYYLTDQLLIQINYFVDNFVHLPQLYNINQPVHVVYLATLLLLAIPSFFYVRGSRVDRNIIYSKKCQILVILLLFSLLPMSYSLEFSEFSYFFSLPLSFMMTIFFFSKRKILYSNAILLLFFVVTLIKIYFTIQNVA
jgi:hypothetical protein